MQDDANIHVGIYSKATKGIFAIGIPFFAGLALFSFWSGAFDSEQPAQRVVHIALGTFFVWVLVFCLRIVPFLRCRILVRDEGIRLSWPSVDRTYSWAALGAFRNRQILQLVDVYDRDGNRVLVFDYHLIGFNEVYGSIAARLPLRA